MFGTIAHARVKPGHEDQINAMRDDWQRDVRPLIPGSFLSLTGKPQGRPDEVVFIALAQDEETYRNLAALPEQHAYYQRMIEHLDGDVSWEDVEMEIETQD